MGVGGNGRAALTVVGQIKPPVGAAHCSQSKPQPGTIDGTHLALGVSEAVRLGDADGEAVAVLLDVGVQLLVNVRVQLVDGLHVIVSVGVRLAL